MALSGNINVGERKKFTAVVDQIAIETRMGTANVERFLQAVYVGESHIGHLWVNKSNDALKFKDVPFGAYVEFDAEVAPYRGKYAMEIRNIENVKVLEAPTMRVIVDLLRQKDADRARRGINNIGGVCAKCGKPAKSNRFRGYNRKGIAKEFCSEGCRYDYLKNEA